MGVCTRVFATSTVFGKAREISRSSVYENGANMLFPGREGKFEDRGFTGVYRNHSLKRWVRLGMEEFTHSCCDDRWNLKLPGHPTPGERNSGCGGVTEAVIGLGRELPDTCQAPALDKRCGGEGRNKVGPAATESGGRCPRSDRAVTGMPALCGR